MLTRGELRSIGRLTEADLKRDAGEGAPVKLQANLCKPLQHAIRTSRASRCSFDGWVIRRRKESKRRTDKWRSDRDVRCARSSPARHTKVMTRALSTTGTRRPRRSSVTPSPSWSRSTYRIVEKLRAAVEEAAR